MLKGMQNTRQCAIVHVFRKIPRCALIVECAVNRMNMVVAKRSSSQYSFFVTKIFKVVKTVSGIASQLQWNQPPTDCIHDLCDQYLYVYFVKIHGTNQKDREIIHSWSGSLLLD